MANITATKAKSLSKYVQPRKAVKEEISSTITHEIEKIDPELAMRYLELKKSNRSISQAVVNLYAEDMQKGNWSLTHQGIAFDWDGHLLDGEHRLWAIIQSQKTIEMDVSRGWDPKARTFVDQGKNRTAQDIVEMTDGTRPHRSATAIAKRLGGIIDRGRTTRAEQVEAFYEHKEAILFAIGLITKRMPKFAHASVLSPIARAWYQAPLRGKLIHFMKVLTTGMPENLEEDEVIILMRNYLLRLPTLQGTLVGEEIYWKMEKALYVFVRGEKVTRIYPATEELFPIPEKITKG